MTEEIKTLVEQEAESRYKIAESEDELVKNLAAALWAGFEAGATFYEQTVLPKGLEEKDEQITASRKARNMIMEELNNEAVKCGELLYKNQSLQSELSQLQSSMEEDIRFAQIEFATWLEDNTEVVKEPKITLYRHHTSEGWANSTLEDIHLEYEEQIKKDYSSVTEFLKSLKSTTQTEGK
jgi:hypothetical protein